MPVVVLGVPAPALLGPFTLKAVGLAAAGAAGAPGWGCAGIAVMVGPVPPEAKPPAASFWIVWPCSRKAFINSILWSAI
jgi:hypothetical protein